MGSAGAIGALNRHGHMGGERSKLVVCAESSGADDFNACVRMRSRVRYLLLRCHHRRSNSRAQHHSSATVPVTADKMLKNCDMSAREGVVGSYYDGPRAFKIYQADILDKAVVKKTKKDKEFYDKAQSLQQDHQLERPGGKKIEK